MLSILACLAEGRARVLCPPVHMQAVMKGSLIGRAESPQSRAGVLRFDLARGLHGKVRPPSLSCEKMLPRSG